MRCLINQLGSSGRFLHRAAEKSVSSILERASRNLEIRAPILKALLTEPFGDVNFDKITGTKLVETILSQMRPFECEPIISLYEELILNPGVQDEKVAASRRLVLGDQLVSALRRRHIESTDNDCGSKNGHVVRSILQLLATFAYFDHANPTGAKGSTMNPSFSPNSRQIYRTRISTCLGHLLATSNDPASYVYNMVRTFRYGDRDFAYGQLLLEADGTVSKVLTSAWAVVEKANLEAEKESTEVSKGRYLRSIILLYSITILEVHNEDADAVSILEELNDIFEEDAEGNKSATGTAALVEILLSFASKSSQLFRRMTQQVFASCTSDIDDACLEALIKVWTTA